MSFEVSQTTQYQIKEMSIITNYGSLDVRNIFIELNIFDHILQPCMSGTIMLNEAVGLSDKFKFDGSEYLRLDISKSEDDIRIEKVFHIYKQSDRKSENMTSETYILYFVSDEFVYSQQQTLNNYIEGGYENVVDFVCSQKLKLDSKEYTIDKTNGVRKIVIPNLTPFETLIWCSKRALNDKNIANFLFFENLYRYNFLSLTTLKNNSSLMDVYFEPKNIQNDLGREMFGVRDYEVVSQFDYLDNISSGVYSGTFIGFDTITRVIIQQELDFKKTFTDNPMNKNYTETKDKNKGGKSNVEMIGSRRVVYPTALNRTETQYIKENDPQSLNLQETPQYFLYQRRAILTHLFSKRIKIALPGNFSITSGVNLNLLKHKSSEYDQEENKDRSLYGKYLVVGTRHILSNNKHDTVVELVTDSINEEKPESSINPNRLKK